MAKGLIMENQKSYFKEEQHFSNPWFWLFLIVVLTMALVPIVAAIYSQVILDKPYGENPESIDVLLIILAVLLVCYTAVILMFRKMRLIVEIRKQGIYYRYPPFINKFRDFQKTEINSFKIRKYRPILEYSGWGVRYSWGKSGRAFNVRGNIGLQLYLANGRKVLFGTQRGDALSRAMTKMMEAK